MRTAPGRPRGFSLVELLFVLVIVGILAGVALPSYLRHIERARRADARAALMEAAQFMQRYYSAKDTFAGATLPPRLSTAPLDAAAGDRRYEITVESDATSYTLKAEPLQGSDPCGTLSLSHTGMRSRSGSALSAAECWR